MANYLSDPIESIETTEEKLYDERTFNFTFHQTNHEVRKQSKKHTYNKHNREVLEKSITIKLEKDSPPAKRNFCNKCMHRGYNGIILSMKHHRIQYFGPKFCKCVSKYMYFEEEPEISN